MEMLTWEIVRGTRGPGEMVNWKLGDLGGKEWCFYFFRFLRLALDVVDGFILFFRFEKRYLRYVHALTYFPYLNSHFFPSKSA